MRALPTVPQGRSLIAESWSPPKTDELWKKEEILRLKLWPTALRGRRRGASGSILLRAEPVAPGPGATHRPARRDAVDGIGSQYETTYLGSAGLQ